MKCTDNYNNNGSFCATGDITIIKTNGEAVESSGEHGSNDFESEYGFILIPQEDY